MIAPQDVAKEIASSTKEVLETQLNTCDSSVMTKLRTLTISELNSITSLNKILTFKVKFQEEILGITIDVLEDYGWKVKVNPKDKRKVKLSIPLSCIAASINDVL